MPETGGSAAPSITPGHAYVGTSGWAYATWKPTFYPAEIKSKDFLRYYATRFSTLEVNYTFNHLPTEKNIATWKDATPPDFLFALKASQQITHVRQLRDPAETVPLFFERAAPLGERFGPVLFQTPPWLKRDDDRLAMFLASLPRERRSALEVRDASWYVDDVYELLRTAGVALVHAEGERVPSPVETLGSTAPFAYVRLRDRAGYPDAAVDTWTSRLRSHLADGPELAAPTPVFAAGIALTVLGIVFALWALATIGRHFDLEIEVHEDHELVRSGPYAFVRHPIYTGFIVHTVGAWLATGNVVLVAGSLVVTFPLLYLRARTEERLLRDELGPRYDAYARDVGMLVPLVGRGAA